LARSATSLTVRSLAGLAIGIGLGVIILNSRPPGSEAIVTIADAIVKAWTNAFRMVVLPLVVAQLYLAVTGIGNGGQLARAGRVIPLVFAGLLILSAAVSALFTMWAVRLPWLGAVRLPEPDVPPTIEEGGGLVSWVTEFIPPNLFGAAASDNILPVMLFAVGFALAARQLEPDLREPLHRLATAVGRAVFIIVDWLLVLVPLLMLCIGLATASRTGATVGGTIVAFTVLEIVAIMAAIAVVVVTSWVALGGPFSRVSRAIGPAQLTAITTRSSLATIPVLMQGFERELPAVVPVASYVIPIAGGLLKLSRAISGATKFLFLAAVLGIPLSAERVVVFIATIILLSPSTVGVPRVTSGSRSLPAYVAAGIPPEYVVLLGATTAITDVFLTMINTTGYFGAAALAHRIQATGDG
jgi:Na+/H+-dicarboxylate symporter